jgi:hypothetical protein
MSRGSPYLRTKCRCRKDDDHGNGSNVKRTSAQHVYYNASTAHIVAFERGAVRWMPSDDTLPHARTIPPYTILCALSRRSDGPVVLSCRLFRPRLPLTTQQTTATSRQPPLKILLRAYARITHARTTHSHVDTPALDTRRRSLSRYFLWEKKKREQRERRKTRNLFLRERGTEDGRGGTWSATEAAAQFCFALRVHRNGEWRGGFVG